MVAVVRDNSLRDQSVRSIVSEDQFPQVRVGRAGWVRASWLADHSSPALDRLLHRWEQQVSPGDRRVAATRLLVDYTRAVSSWAVACVLIERVVPDMRNVNVWLRVTDRATFSGLALHQQDSSISIKNFTPLSEETDGSQVRERLWQWLIEEHIVGIMTHIAQRSALPIKTQRGLLVDTLAQVFLRIGRLSGDGERCQQEAHAFFQRRGWPTPKVHETAPDTYVVARRVCCLKYALPDRDRCATCPGRSLTDQQQCLCTWMEECHIPKE